MATAAAARLWLCAALGAAAAVAAEAASGNAGAGQDAHLWPHSRGRVGSYSESPVRGPRNLSEALLWKWHHPEGKYHTVIVGGAIFDENRSIYLTTEGGIWKFRGDDGHVLWYHETRDMGVVPSSASIMGGHIFGATQSGWMFKLELSTGREVWRVRHAGSAPGDTSYVEAHGGVVLTGVDPSPRWGGGATRLICMRAEDGGKLWEFFPDSPSWNFQAQFSSDGGSFIFQDLEGKAYRVGLSDGALIWKSGLGDFIPSSFSDGGALLAEAEGTVYAVANQAGDWTPSTPGVIYALNFTDGRLLWSQWVGRLPNSWPVVGPLQRGAKPSVVIPVGKQGDQAPIIMTPPWMPTLVKLLLHRLSLWLGDYQMYLWRVEPMPLDIYAFDARSGSRQWIWHGPVHRRVACGGDEEGILTRLQLGRRPLCWPGPWSSPTIDAEGTVYVGAQNGEFIALWDGDGDGRIDDATEVSRFDTGASALHPGPALVPGLLAYPTCDGLFVFRASG